MTFTTTANVVPSSPIWTQSGSATPILSFDGNSVGVTYTRQIFNWQRLGDWVFFHGRVTLSAKGISTGAVRIGAGALPFASADANVSGYPIGVSFLNFAAIIGDSYIVADVVAGTTNPYVRMYRFASGSRVGISEADLTDASDIIFNGSYRCA